MGRYLPVVAGDRARPLKSPRLDRGDARGACGHAAVPFGGCGISESEQDSDPHSAVRRCGESDKERKDSKIAIHHGHDITNGYRCNFRMPAPHAKPSRVIMTAATSASAILRQNSRELCSRGNNT